MIDWEMIRVVALNGYKLGSVGEVRSEPLVGSASNTVVLEFVNKDFMVYCVKGFLEINENATCKFAFVKGFPDIFSNFAVLNRIPCQLWLL